MLFMYLHLELPSLLDETNTDGLVGRPAPGGVRWRSTRVRRGDTVEYKVQLSGKQPPWKATDIHGSGACLGERRKRPEPHYLKVH